MNLLGHFGSEHFEFVEIRLNGCALPDQEQCASDEEIAKTTFDIALLESIPDILGLDNQNFVKYQQDLNNFYYLDPSRHHNTNIFFMESTIRHKEKVWDIFDFTE